MQMTVFPELLYRQLQQGVPVLLKVNSKSMRPLIQPGDILEVKCCSIDTLTCGDIVTIWQNDLNILLTHRLIRIDPDKKQIILRGDANKMNDHPINFEAYLGKVVTIKRGQRTFELYQGYFGLLNKLVFNYKKWVQNYD